MLQQTIAGSSSIVMQRQAPLRSAYARHPERALIRKTASAFSSPADDAMHNCVVPGDEYDTHWRLGIDRSIGGFHDAPNPGELLCAALAACQHASLRMTADAMGVALENLEVEVTGTVDARGCMGIDRDAAVGFTDMRCKVRFRAAAATRPEVLARLTQVAERSCVNLATLRQGLSVLTEFETLGSPARPSNARS